MALGSFGLIRISSLPRLIICGIVLVLFGGSLWLWGERVSYVFDFYSMASIKQKKRGTAVPRSKSCPLLK